MVETQEWSQAFEDIELKNGWVIRYSGSNEEYKPETTLHLDPQGAFGTGVHGTTQDCLEVILECDFRGKRVLDLGTGSGILSIAALLKGAQEVIAVDLEPVEREILHHAHLNGVKQIQIVQADLIDGSYRIQDWFDWIFINIGGDEAKMIINRHELLEKSNHFLVSGLVEWHTEHVTSMFKNAGFSLRKRLQSDEWVTMYFNK
jgi:ribosomal protein L11 methyltransferase